MKRIAIIGGGELGQQIKNIADTILDIKVVGFFDDLISEQNDEIWIHPLKDIINLYHKGIFDGLSMGIGYKHFKERKDLFCLFSREIPFINVISPHSFIDSTVQLGSGIVIYPGVIVDKETIINDNVLVNLGSCISHNCYIGHSTYFAPRVAMSGYVKIGERCFVGTNTTFVDHVKITNDVFLGAASLVLKDVAESGKYVGTRLRKIG
jgi:sugar O-acyltransferase (sialic acid O-acetyltransferase NeuD family)